MLASDRMRLVRREQSTGALLPLVRTNSCKDRCADSPIAERALFVAAVDEPEE